MEDKKNASKKELKLVKQNGKEKKVWSVKKILTTVIIAILALLMVGGSFYYILAPGFSKKSQAFGFYDGEPILYEANNLFARTIMADEDYANAYSTGDYSTIYNSWYKAYQSQVDFVAISQMAEKAGLLAPKSLVEQSIIDSGAFDDENGNFNAETYNSLSEADKRSYYSYMESVYPFQVVVNELLTALTSAKEKEFVADNSSDARTFEYFIVGANAYPDNLAKAYATEHKDDIKIVDVSMISCETEENVKACYEALNNGTSWADAVQLYSVDSYATNEGKLGFETFAGVFANNMNDAENISKIVALNVDEYTEPIEGPYSWTIYKLNAAVEILDLSDSNNLAQVKQYIFEKDADLVNEYIEKTADEATALANANFEEAAEKYGFGLVSIGPAVNNIGSSSLVYGVDYYDTNGYLATALEADEMLNASMFTEDVGYVVGPVSVEGVYLFARVSDKSVDETMSMLSNSMYTYYAPQFDLLDFENGILTSDKHEDNFITRFFDIFFGTAN